MSVCALLFLGALVQQTTAMPTSSVEGADSEEGDRHPDINEINKGLDLHEGDILLMSGHERNAILGDHYRWDIPVPYVLDHSLDVNAKGVILRAMEQIRLKTCVDFKPRETESNYISVIKDEGCYSYVGNQRWGNQSLSIGQWCDHLAIVEHEFIHALGFWHEQSRYDRDDYVTVIWDNIEEGKQHNFIKYSADQTTSLGTPYDYNSVMHYGKDDFSNGNGSTIVTLQPEFQYVIGQRLEMSPNDVLKLNLLYNCTSAVTFLESCSFEESMCGMVLCAIGNASWERVGSAQGGPSSDHTSLGALPPEARKTVLENNSSSSNETDFSNSTSTNDKESGGLFMHYRTAQLKEGEGAKMQSRMVTPHRPFQCLQFYYYHSGGDQDLLNIWIREYGEVPRGTLHLVAQITGPPSNHWQLNHVSLNATRTFTVEFEVIKGAGESTGGFSVDDINLSETECPHHVWHVPNFDHILETSREKSILGPKFSTAEGYVVQFFMRFYSDYFGLFFHLVSGQFDDRLQWPCPWRQVTVQLLDQKPHIQQRMSKQFSITTDPHRTFTSDTGETLFYWDKPGKVGSLISDSNSSFYVGPNLGYRRFLSYNALWSGDFMKGGDIFFLISFDDFSSHHMNRSAPPTPRPKTDFSQFTLSNRADGETCLNQQGVVEAVTSSTNSLFTDVMLLLLVCFMTAILQLLTS